MKPVQCSAVQICTTALVVVVVGILAPIRKSWNHISLFTTLRRFPADSVACNDDFLQILAIHSWLQFAEDVILLVDDDSGCMRAGISSKIRCVRHHCMNPEFGKPTMGCLFMHGQALGRNEILMYTNPDFVYTGVTDTVQAVAHVLDELVIVGRRISIEPEHICMTTKLINVRQLVNIGGRQGVDPNHAGWAMDYFIFSRHSLPIEHMPPFLVGVWRWDNWLLGETIRLRGVSVVDASSTIMAIHLGNTTTRLQDRTGASYNNLLWKSTLHGGHVIPKPAGLGDIQFSSFFSLRHENHVEIMVNRTAVMLVNGYLAAIDPLHAA
jgi:hypothetical protein